MSSRAYPFGLCALLVVLVGAAAVAGAAESGGPGDADRVTVSASDCVPGWSIPGSGDAAYDVTNQSPVVVAVDLLRLPSHAVVQSIKVLGPDTSRELTARLSPGRYRFECLYDDASARLSTTVRTTTGVAPDAATPAVRPTTLIEMAGPVLAYRNWVTGQIGVLQGQVGRLVADLQAGDTARARTDWFDAEMTYTGIGGAYGALGGLEDAINGGPQEYPRGVDDPDFVGLHRIESMLWSGRPASAVLPFATGLRDTVDELQVLWGSGEAGMTANLLSTRAHEILEDALRDTLSGDDDQGSGTQIARTWEDVQAEQEVLHVLRGVLDRHAPTLLGVAEPQLQALDQALVATKVDGQWVPLGALTTGQRELIDADTGQVLETLSTIPDILEVQQFSDGGGT